MINNDNIYTLPANAVSSKGNLSANAVSSKDTLRQKKSFDNTGDNWQGKSKQSKSSIYVCDFLNIFSDYREIKYKKNNIDFHSLKHLNKELDTLEFFKLFFTKYIRYAKIDINSNFIFILKKITNYDSILIKILKLYKHINMRFIVIETKYLDMILDKNKDDFLCQYLFCFLLKQNDNCILISNDKYRDLNLYLHKFDNTFIRILKLNKNMELENSTLELEINENSICQMIFKFQNKYNRCTIPKNQLYKLL